MQERIGWNISDEAEWKSQGGKITAILAALKNRLHIGERKESFRKYLSKGKIKPIKYVMHE